MKVTKELYRIILGFIKDPSEPTILEEGTARSKYRKEQVLEWYKEYKDLRSRVDKLREELIESGKNISAEDKLFKDLVFGQNSSDNWISKAGQHKSSKLSEEAFENFKQNDDFIKSLTELIKDPSRENFITFGYAWRDAGGGNKRLYINRVVAACSDKVSSTASSERFVEVFKIFHEHKLIEPYSGTRVGGNLLDGEWYDENIHLIEELHRIFKDELDSGKIDPILISILVWEIYELRDRLPDLIESIKNQ